MHSIILCEDNAVQLNQLATIVKNYVLFHEENFRYSLGSYSPEACLSYVDNHNIIGGIYFLDIDLNSDMDGIELALQIREKDVQAKIIFVTTHSELAPQTLKRKVEALAFIDKEESLEHIRDEVIESLALAKYRSQQLLQDEGEKFTFSIGSRIFNLNQRDILFLEPSVVPHRITVHAKYGKYEFYGKLNECEKKYPNLFRSSKSALINLENVIEYDSHTKTINFGSNITCKCSILKTKELKQRLLETN